MRDHYYMMGWGLISIGGLSGAALFIRAAFSNMKDAENSTATLWGLFLLGLIGGFFLLRMAHGA